MRHGDASRSALAIIALMLSAPAWAQGASKNRQDLQERLGIKKVPKAPTAPAQSAPDAGVLPETAGPTPSQPKKPNNPSPAQPRAVTYVDNAGPVLEQKCGGCHRPGEKGGTSEWIFGGDTRANYDAALRFVNPAAPTQSQLLRKGSGSAIHSGGKVIATDSVEYAMLQRWIESGARFRREDATPPTSVRATTPTLPIPSMPPSASSAAGLAASEPAKDVSPQVEQRPDTRVPFVPKVHELLTTSCSGCHGPGKSASMSRYVTSPEPQRHFEVARALVVPGSSTGSVLHQRARGEAHVPGAVWAPGSPELELLTGWIDGGAINSLEEPTAPEPAATPPPTATSSTPIHPVSAGPGAHGGISLGTHPFLGSFRLNGRFDLNYERTGETNALRSYHHFLFLTRQSAEDPVSITLEMLSLQFWEVGLRISRETSPVQVSAKFGKVLVPFGGDPLFHHSYGGHAGFDQKILPPVFAREGVTANIQGRWQGVSLSGDLYMIAGYGLKRADSVLSLAADFAPLEDARLGFGARLGASRGPISVWYSPYVNTLGFGRTLFLQALDVAVWRPRGIKVLEDFSFGAGLLRGDVSGGADQGYGGSDADYYHFASYLQLRYYPRDWLYVQYRQGLRTFNNRRGVFFDETDLTREDGSTHNLGILARWRGLSAGLFHYWNLEKADEVPDDFTRLVVAFDF